MSTDMGIPPADEKLESKVELKTSSGHVICLSFPDQKESPPKIIELVDPDSRQSVIFQCENGIYQEAKQDSIPNLLELQQQHRDHHCSNNIESHPYLEVQQPNTGDERRDKRLVKLQRKLRERRASTKQEEEHCNSNCHVYIQIPVQGLYHMCGNAPGSDPKKKDIDAGEGKFLLFLEETFVCLV